MVAAERIGLDIAFKASIIGEVPFLRSSLPRSDEYVEVQMRAPESRRRAEEPQHEQEQRSRRYIILVIVLFCVMASCGLIVSLLVLRGKRGANSDADQFSSAVSDQNAPSEISDFAPSGTPEDLQPSIESPTKLPTQPPMQSSEQQPIVPQVPIPSLPPTAAFPPNPLTIVGTSPRPTLLAHQPTDADFSVVLESGRSLSRSDAIYSPNGLYVFMMDKDNGDLILLGDDDEVLWRADGDGAETCHMQSDGNLVLRKSDRTATWKSETSGNRGAHLLLDRDGQLAIISDDDSMSRLWFTGIPKGQYSVREHSLSFPIRGTFYFAWYPESWTVRGNPVIYTPSLGKYSLEESGILRAHIDAIAYANVKLSIVSWFGPDTNLDRARLSNLLEASCESSVQWTVYHEMERQKHPSVSEIKADLRYLKKWFAWHSQWAHVDGKPLVFVYNDASCNVSDRWMEAAGEEWYVVMKSFGESEECYSQPNHWHDYGPSTAIIHDKGYSYSISPGFWRADQELAMLPRSLDDLAYSWRTNVQAMVDSNEPWQLITTFNEWGDGTAMESGVEWESSSGYGEYLDILHEISN